MNARNDFNRLFFQSLDANAVLVAARRRLAARVDLLVARWLARCAANIEAAQWAFETDSKPAPQFGVGHGTGHLNATSG
jgi:hypothetical protein